MSNLPTPNFPLWDGAWPEDVLFSFLALTGDESIKSTEATRTHTLRDLANPEAARHERIAELIALVHAHDGYKRLKRLPEYDRVMTERQRLGQANSLFGDPFGEIRLAHIISILVGSFNPKFTPKRATLAQQRKVLKATRRLRDLLIPGAQPTDVFEMSELRRSLRNLENQLDQRVKLAETIKARPYRADKDAAQRYWIVGFCKSLRTTFGEGPPTIVTEVAGMIGYTPDGSTIARYIERAADPLRG